MEGPIFFDDEFDRTAQRLVEKLARLDEQTEPTGEPFLGTEEERKRAMIAWFLRESYTEPE